MVRVNAQDPLSAALPAIDAPPPAPATDHGAPLPRWMRSIARLPVVAAAGAASVLDASILPNPLEPLLMAGMLAKRHRTWMIAVAATVGCMIGASLTYMVGLWLLEPVAEPLMARFGLLEQFEEVKERFREDGGLAIFIIAMTPVPLPLAPLGAGATGLNPFVAIGLVGLFRGIRYFAIAAVAWHFAPALRQGLAKASSPWATAAMLAVGVAGLAWIFLF